MKLKNRKSGNTHKVLVFNEKKIVIEIKDCNGNKRTQWIDPTYITKKWEVIK